MGYAIARPKGQKRINSITSIDADDISEMPGIKNTLSYSITAPSRMNYQKPFATPTFAPQSTKSNHEQYIPPIKPSKSPNPTNTSKKVTKTKSNEPLPSHIFKTFQRKLYVKQRNRQSDASENNDTSKSQTTTMITISPPQTTGPKSKSKDTKKPTQKKELPELHQQQDMNGMRETYDSNRNEADFTVTTSTNLNNYHKGSGAASVISASTQSSDEDEMSPKPTGYPANNRHSVNLQSPSNELGANQDRDKDHDKRGSFSSLNHWLSAKRSTMFSADYVSTYLQPFDETNDDDNLIPNTNGNEKGGKNPKTNVNITPYLHPMDATRDKSPSMSVSLMANIFDSVVGLGNLPSPNVLRRISRHKSQIERENNMKKLDLDEENKKDNNNLQMNATRATSPSVFAPPLTQKMLDMRIARPSLFGMNRKPKRSIIKDVNLIIDIGDNFCALCQNMYNENDVLIVLSSCNHQFHESCAKEWFQYKSACPICKKKISVL